jgi:SAM-dependent methyltransferase
MRADLDLRIPEMDSSRLRHVVIKCARGDLPPNMGLMHALIAANDASEAERSFSIALAAAERGGAQLEAARLRAAIDLWRRAPDAFRVVRSVLAIEGGQASEIGRTSQWGPVFDRAAEISPEAAVALYSLGSPALLEAATGEIVERMRAWNLLGPDRTALEIGCGIGRCVEKLAREMRLAVGIDVAQNMLELARVRCGGIEGVGLVRSSGRDLAAVRDASFDVVLAVDSFPYLVRSGAELAAGHIRDARRVLKSGGSLLILNYSYRGDTEADRTDIARLAAESHFEICRNGTREFALWDGLAFLLRRSDRELPVHASHPGNAAAARELPAREGS